jgi:hypothetical protein
LSVFRDAVQDCLDNEPKPVDKAVKKMKKNWMYQKLNADLSMVSTTIPLKLLLLKVLR